MANFRLMQPRLSVLQNFVEGKLIPPGTGWCPSWIPLKRSCVTAPLCHQPGILVTRATRCTLHSTQAAGSAWRHERRPVSAPLKVEGKMSEQLKLLMKIHPSVFSFLWFPQQKPNRNFPLAIGILQKITSEFDSYTFCSW